MKKIGIYFLGYRRLDLLRCHLPQIAKSKYKDFHFYLMSNSPTEYHRSLLEKYIPGMYTIVGGFSQGLDYMEKVNFALNRNHEFSIKMDEDCFMLSSSWDRFFSLIENMTNKDLFCSGAISNGIPSCDMFIRNFIPQASQELSRMFSETRFSNMGLGVDYSSLNSNEEWNPSSFYRKVKQINHYYKGIHPVRVNFASARKINDFILSDPIKSMTPIEAEIIKDVEQYPYFCNSFFGIRTEDWKTIVSRTDLFVDPFEEVPLNRYRTETKRNMVLDTGIPILHTMYNWSTDSHYEANLIREMTETYENA